MTKLNVIILGLLVIISLGACKGKKEATGISDKEVEINLYCSGAEYTSDKKHFRASGTGKSNNLEIAKEKAYSNTRGRLAALINVTVKTVTDNYAKSATMNGLALS